MHTRTHTYPLTRTPAPRAPPRRYATTVSVTRGPLLFSLNIPGNYTVLASYAFDSKYVALMGGPWVVWP